MRLTHVIAIADLFYYRCSRLFFIDTATTEIYTYRHPLSLHYALPICRGFAASLTWMCVVPSPLSPRWCSLLLEWRFLTGITPKISRDRKSVAGSDRKSTRLNSSH